METTLEPKRVKRIEFTILSSEEIKKMSVCRVTKHEDVDPQTNKPIEGGLSDPRMGPFEKGDLCRTCHFTRAECPGHFGYIDLFQPVYNPIYIPYILKILKCVCPQCKRLYCKGDKRLKDIKGNKEIRLNKIIEFIKKEYMNCGRLKKPDQNQPVADEDLENICGHSFVDYELPKSKLENKLEIRIKDKENKDERKFFPRDALDIFKEMADEDVIALGFNPEKSHPKNMIFTYFPVPPPAVRPSVMTDKGKHGLDDLTVILKNIITANDRLKEEAQKSSGINTSDEKFIELQTICARMFKKNVKETGNLKSKKKFKSIEERLSGKQGRLRLNLMGKRVDFSARTVISPDPNLSMDEVGVPTGIAKVLTFPEKVTELNKAKLQHLVDMGMDQYPGAYLLERKNGTTFRLGGSQKIVAIGDIVHRYLMNGDYVIFNRQPSLHRMSMMGHKVRVLPFSTFRMNLCDTTPYNADFDGDEMNLHVPQTLEARAEVATLMLTPTQILTPESNKPIMSIVQDTQCGSYLITKRETFIEKAIFYNILQWLDNFNGEVPLPTILKPKVLWTGKQVFSEILPPINYERGNYSLKELLRRGPEPDEKNVYIHNGKLLVGSLCNGSGFGRNASGIIQSMYKDYGMEATKTFFNKTQSTVNSWLLTRGFTIGVGDIVVEQNVHDSIRNHIEKVKVESEGIFTHENDADIEAIAGNTMFDNLEAKISGILLNLKKSCDDLASKALKSDNNLLSMVNSGSKGSQVNISQMVAFVGKQEINNLRIPFGFYKRTLPHYWKEDYGFVSRGFCENSYVMGLTPQEFFFHAMAGRQGIIDTAIKTSETGYIQRRLVKSMEDVQCKYDRTVRRTTGDMVEFMYGGDGVDSLMCQTITQADENFMHKTYYWDIDTSEYAEFLPFETLSKMNDPEYRQQLDDEFQTIKKERKVLFSEKRQVLGLKIDDVHVVVNFDRQIANTIARIRPNKFDLDPVYVIEKTNEMLERLKMIGNDPERTVDTLNTFKCLLHSKVSSKQCIIVHRFTKDAFDSFLKSIEEIYEKSRVNPGEMVGSIAAQSIGAPATQMTLNTFHHAVPRLRELLNMSKDPKTPSMTVTLNMDEFTTDITRESLDRELSKILPYTLLKTLTTRAEIWFDPDPKNGTVIEEDADFVETYFDVDDVNMEAYSKWVIRLLLGYDKIQALGIEDTQDFISNKIKEYFPTAFVIESGMNNEINGEIQVVVHIRFAANEVPMEPSRMVSFHRERMEKILRDVVLSGVDGISKIFVDKPVIRRVINPQTLYIENQAEWVISTEGSNMKSVCSMDIVNFRKTITNNVYEIYEFLGIEAGRIQLAAEFLSTLSGSYVNYRHLCLLADIMTQTGRLEPVNRLGLSRSRAGVITRASFEQTLEQFKKAAAFCESDMLNGISQNILMGQNTIVGTGSFTLVVDLGQLKTQQPDEVVEMEHKMPQTSNRPTNPFIQFSPARNQTFSPDRGGNQSGGSYSPTQGYNSPSLGLLSPSVGPTAYFQQSSPIFSATTGDHSVSPAMRSSPYMPQSSPYLSSPYLPQSSPNMASPYFPQSSPNLASPGFASPYLPQSSPNLASPGFASPNVFNPPTKKKD
ncbi:DNA-directed RNA polymerase subunit [Entamoeba marina]